MDYRIDEMKAFDWHQVASIYKEGIETGIATLQPDVPGWEEWDQGHEKSCRLVARSGERILGWAALSPTSVREVYAGVVEVSIYVKETCHGQGIGKALLTHLVKCSEEKGFWTLQAGIMEGNEASVGLHLSCGFRVLGVREKLGKMPNGIWHNVIFMERRSRSVGIEK